MNRARQLRSSWRRASFGISAWMLSLSLLLPTLVAQQAQAQAGTHDLARRMVSEGIEAAKSNDWETARERFQKAYDVKPVPQTLYNLAAAQEKTGQLVEADRSYRLYLRETEASGNDQFRTLAQQRREELVKRIAHVTITIENLGPDDVLLVNEKEVSLAVVGESIPVNPGWNKVLLRRDGADAAGQNVQLTEGASLAVPLAPPPYVAPTIATPAPAPVAAAAPSANESASPSSAAVAESEADPEEEGSLMVPLLLGGGALVTVGVVAAGAATAAALLLIPGDPSETSLDPVTINGL